MQMARTKRRRTIPMSSTSNPDPSAEVRDAGSVTNTSVEEIMKKKHEDEEAIIKHMVELGFLEVESSAIKVLRRGENLVYKLFLAR